MDRDKTQNIDDRAPGLIKEAVGKIAGDKKAHAVDGETSPSTCKVRRGSLIRGGEPSRNKSGLGPENSHGAVDHPDIYIYGAHPRDD